MEGMESLKGELLISNAGLFDPNFRRTVILIGEHNEDGALGVVLNRPTDLKVRDVVPSLATVVGNEATLFIGGPVMSNDVVVLAEFDDPARAVLPVIGGIGFLTGELDELAFEEVGRVRVFAGYSGWGPGQLEAEMEEGSWLIEPALPEDVFIEDPDELWTRVLHRKGGNYKLLATMPYDPQLN